MLAQRHGCRPAAWARRGIQRSLVAVLAMRPRLHVARDATRGRRHIRLGPRARRSPRRSSAWRRRRPATGYWLVASDGGIFTLRRRARSTARPAACSSTSRSSAWRATPTGRGYWLVASDGGIFTFGDAALPRIDRRHAAQQADRRHGRARRRATATGSSHPTAASSRSATPRFYGSTGGMRSNKPIVGMAATPTGRGYWLVASDGGIFTFGDAHLPRVHGSRRRLAPDVAMAGHRGTELGRDRPGGRHLDRNGGEHVRIGERHASHPWSFDMNDGGGAHRSALAGCGKTPSFRAAVT